MISKFFYGIGAIGILISLVWANVGITIAILGFSIGILLSYFGF